MPDSSPLLVEFPVITELPILWGDQDAFGHVNNVAYLRWCETARVDYLRRVGLFPDLPPQGIGPILASLKCDYRLPLNYPDVVRIGTRVTAIDNSSFGMEHLLVSTGLQQVAAESFSTLVVFDYQSGKPVPVSSECCL
jgi:acyl-CoA thioester hydrolase